MSRSPLIIAHRGASSDAPENTLAAFQMAIEAGADGLEFDVQLSSDGVPMVIHDATLERTGLRPESIADLTAAELSNVEVGSWFNAKYPDRGRPEFAHEMVPTLAQVLDVCRNFSGLIYVELKVNVPDYVSLAAAVCDVISESPLLRQMIVKSFKLEAIAEVRHRMPGVQTAALFEPTIAGFLRGRKHLVALAREFGADQISLHYSLVSRRLAALAAQAGMPVTVWTVNDSRWLRRARDLGIRAVITNEVSKLVSSKE